MENLWSLCVESCPGCLLYVIIKTELNLSFEITSKAILVEGSRTKTKGPLIKVLSAGTTRKHTVVLPETFVTDTRMFFHCFPVLPHWKHCFQQQNYFCFTAETYSGVAKLGNIGEIIMCPQQMFLATCFLYSFCQGFTSDWLRKWREFFESMVMKNKSKRKLLSTLN